MYSEVLFLEYIGNVCAETGWLWSKMSLIFYIFLHCYQDEAWEQLNNQLQNIAAQVFYPHSLFLVCHNVFHTFTHDKRWY